MGTTYNFPSLGHGDKFGYMLHTGWFEYSFRCEPLYCVASWAGFYQTYGDRNVQHSNDSLVPMNLLGDYVASLTHFCAQPGNEEVLAAAASHYRSMTSHGSAADGKKVRAAMQVRYKEGKTRYVKADDLSVSSSDSKRHDRRWFEVVPWMDGSVDSVFSLLHLGKPSLFGLSAMPPTSWCSMRSGRRRTTGAATRRSS